MQTHNHSNRYRASTGGAYGARTAAEIAGSVRISLKSYSAGQHSTTCPECSAQRSRAGQRITCLSVKIDDDGVRWNCHHCNWSGGQFFGDGTGADRQHVRQFDSSGNIAALQQRGWRIASTYDYTDAAGALVYQNVRAELFGSSGRIAKTFRHRRPSPDGGWIENLVDLRRVPYRLPEIIASTGDVHITEGEKDADRLVSLGLTATSIAAPETCDLTVLKSRAVYVHEDNDKAGREKSAKLTVALSVIAASVTIVHYADAGDGGDVSDWLNQGHTLAELEARIVEAKSAPKSTEPPGAPDMSIVQRVTAPAPKLDLNLFGALAGWIEQAAESKSAPTDYVAIALLGGAAGVIGATRWVTPWDGWREPALLWMMLVGPPSASKSPALDAVRSPLGDVEREAQATWPETKRAHEAAEVVADARREQWEDEAREATKAGSDAPLKPSEADVPDAPQMPRVIITDVTIEAAASILAGNPRGLVLWRDECAHWLANLGKYGDGDRAFWLEANGARPYTVDRKKHPEPLCIEHLAISIVGGIQPDRLATLLMAGDDDGLGARFLYSWPDAVPPIRPTRRPDASLAVRTLRRLSTLAFRSDPTTGNAIPVTLPVEPAALDVFQEWREAHHAASSNTTGLLASAFGKAQGQALRLALVLELLWWAGGSDELPEPEAVSAEALGAALTLIEEYFKPMLQRVLGEAALPVVDRHAAILARAIQQRKPTQINIRQVCRKWRLPGMREAEVVKAAVNALEDAGWLIALPAREGATSGRKRQDYAVDPRIFGGQP